MGPAQANGYRRRRVVPVRGVPATANVQVYFGPGQQLRSEYSSSAQASVHDVPPPPAAEPSSSSRVTTSTGQRYPRPAPSDRHSVQGRVRHSAASTSMSSKTGRARTPSWTGPIPRRAWRVGTGPPCQSAPYTKPAPSSQAGAGPSLGSGIPISPRVRLMKHPHGYVWLRLFVE